MPTKPDDRRLIEDYLPIKAISIEVRRQKSVRKGHISTLHLWRARRPLVACRAAISRFRSISARILASRSDRFMIYRESEAEGQKPHSNS